MLPLINYFTFLNLSFLRFKFARLSQSDCPIPWCSIPLPEIKLATPVILLSLFQLWRRLITEKRKRRNIFGIWEDIIVVVGNIGYCKHFPNVLIWLTKIKYKCISSYFYSWDYQILRIFISQRWFGILFSLHFYEI